MQRAALPARESGRERSGPRRSPVAAAAARPLGLLVGVHRLVQPAASRLFELLGSLRDRVHGFDRMSEVKMVRGAKRLLPAGNAMNDTYVDAQSELESAAMRSARSSEGNRRLFRGIVYFAALFIAGCSGGGGSSAPTGNNSGGTGPVTLQSIEVTPTNANVPVGKLLPLTATGHYSDGSTRPLTGVVYWSSASKLVATVDVSGGVSALSAGSSQITATSPDNPPGISASVVVNVLPGLASLQYLYVFGVGPDGLQPNGPLLQARDGSFYGTTRSGGGNTCFDTPFFCGTLFKVTAAGVESVLYTFSPTAGYWPTAPLIQVSDGSLYGSTAQGGVNDSGVVFKSSTDGRVDVLYAFGGSASDGQVPSAVIQGSDGNFYGTTAAGGANYCPEIPGDAHNCGTVFKITPDGHETVLYSFGTSSTDGVEPIAPLVQASDGNLYGTTSGGGAYGGGSVFKIAPDGTETLLYSFGATPVNGAPPQGLIPQGSLIQASDGNLYGTTAEGGPGNCQYGCGTVFKITLGGILSTLYAFGGLNQSDGYGPAPFLVQGQDGNFYGTLRSGGAFGGDLNGAAFRLTPSGTEDLLYSFGPSDTNPSDPLGGLIQGSDGAFYGVTTYPGAIGGGGTVFALTLEN